MTRAAAAAAGSVVGRIPAAASETGNAAETGKAAEAAEAAAELSWEHGRITTIRRLATADPGSLPLLAPGLVDLQVNGYGGLDVNADPPDPRTLIELSHLLASHGTTTWLPTVVTAPEQRILRALRCVREAREADSAVADAVPSAHVEGPFISDRQGARGVHDPAFVRPPDPDEAARWLRAGPVGMVTVSPHGPDAPRHIRALIALGLTVALGHTHAEPDEITAAVDAGASLSTHLGNGIPTTLSRHPNILWRQLAEDRLSAGLIADLHHLPPDTLEVMLRAKGAGRAFLVSDSTEIGGRAPGRYRSAVGSLVELGDDRRLSEVGGDLLAGAAATLFDGVRNVAAATTLSVRDALALATRNPGRLAPGARPGVGELRVGGPADLILLDDADPRAPILLGVVQGGHRVRPRASHAPPAPFGDIQQPDQQEHRQERQ